MEWLNETIGTNKSSAMAISNSRSKEQSVDFEDMPSSARDIGQKNKQ